jgi:hypothetical protein
MKIKVHRINYMGQKVDPEFDCEYFTIIGGVISLFNENESLPFKAIKDWIYMERLDEEKKDQ